MAADPRKRARILLVEDGPALQAVLQERLQAEGWEVWVAASVAEGQALLRRPAYDLLILDWQLPDGLADQLIAQAEAHGARPAVICISAGAVPAAVLSERTIGHFLAKPFDVRELVRLARVALQSRADGLSGRRQPMPLDARLADQVRTVLQINSILRGTGPIEVEALDGVVVLSGKVGSEAQQHEAGKAALRLPGVRLVINRLKVTTHGESCSAPGESKA